MKESLHVLVVDDKPANVALLTAMLKKMGHQAVSASSGEEALDLFRQRRPDMVLMDVMMPGIGGYEAISEMRRFATEWFPVVFVTAMGQSADIVRGIEAGGDDYLTKPIDQKILQVKINSLHDRLLLNRQLEQQNQLLSEYRERNEEEQAIAAGYMQKMISLDKVHDPAVQFYLKSATNFSGDLIAIARTPDARLHLLLADSTGHGLSAALAAMPVIHPFYSMTGKGFSISAIAREMNNKVWHSLPASHFVAAILVSVDPIEQVIQVWNGGCPPPVMLDCNGEKVHHFSPRHLALGILPTEQFDDSVEYYSAYDGEGCCLLMFSDGVIELENLAGERFGLERLLQTAHSAVGAEHWQNMIAAIDEFSVGQELARDDIAMMMVHCTQEDRQGQSYKQGQGQEQGQGQVIWQFSLSLDIHQVRKLDVVPLLLDIVQQIEKDKRNGGEIFLILSELFNNALDHGLLKLNSSLKHHAAGMERYFDERTTRLATLAEGKIDLSLGKVLYDSGDVQLKIRICDSGEGFDHQYVRKQIAEGTQRHGRGIPLLYKMCRSVEFLGSGSEVLVCFDQPAAAGSA